MEIFVSLTATLSERVSYAALVVTFLGIWRNFIILHPELNLKNNFIIRETFQDVLLYCHFAVILIPIFSEKYPYLECPLHLIGTDCVEVFFSSNGSIVANKHTYTILDMKRNLKAMNSLNEIRTKNKNKNMKFRKAHSKQDNIWKKQYPEEDRPELETKVHRKLKLYPNKDEIIESWRQGVRMAKDLGRRLRLDVRPRPGDDDNDHDFFFKPFKKFSFLFDCDVMMSETVLEFKEEDTDQLGYNSEN